MKRKQYAPANGSYGHANGTGAPRVQRALYDPNLATLQQLVHFLEQGCLTAALNKFHVEHLLAAGMAVRVRGRIYVTKYGVDYAVRNA